MYDSYTLERVPYRWLTATLAALVGIEPHEVMQALYAHHRLPVPGDSMNIRSLSIWARTDAGRALLVALRHDEGMNWTIIGARDLTPDEVAQLEAWEATR